MRSQKIKDTIQAIKDGEKELKEGKTIVASSLHALIVKKGQKNKTQS